MSLDMVSFIMGQMASGGGSVLPKGYRQLEYIESTGTQHIDSLIGDSNGLLCVLIGCLTEQQADVDWVTLCGVESEAHSNHQIFVGKFGNADTYDSGANGVVNTNIPIVYGTAQLFISDTRNGDNYMAMGGVRYYRRAGGTLTDLTVGLFALKAGADGWSPGAKGRIGRVQFYGSTGTLLGDFIAAKRVSDGALGLYDLVTDTLLTNGGSGTFIPGPDA